MFNPKNRLLRIAWAIAILVAVFCYVIVTTCSAKTATWILVPPAIVFILFCIVMAFKDQFRALTCKRWPKLLGPCDGNR